MDFANAEQLLVLCEENKKPISWVMRQREHELTGASLEEIEERMKKAYRIMEESAHAPLEKEIPSIGGLIGGEAARLEAQKREREEKKAAALQKVRHPYVAFSDYGYKSDEDGGFSVNRAWNSHRLNSRSMYSAAPS